MTFKEMLKIQYNLTVNFAILDIALLSNLINLKLEIEQLFAFQSFEMLIKKTLT